MNDDFLLGFHGIFCSEQVECKAKKTGEFDESEDEVAKSTLSAELFCLPSCFKVFFFYTKKQRRLRIPPTKKNTTKKKEKLLLGAGFKDRVGFLFKHFMPPFF